MTTPPLTPVGLRCAHQVDPLGVAPDRVRLSWTLDGTGRDRIQRAYQVEVAGDPAWDTGRVASGDSSDIAYDGPSLAPGGRYTWRVRVWDENDAPSEWSEPASFEVELEEWHASWIGLGAARESFNPPDAPGPPDPLRHAMGPSPFLRRAFTVGGGVVAARLHITALGLYEARLNGRRVGDALLTPGWTDYDRRVLYQTYDVTDQLAAGENVLGAILADGWYCGFVGFDAKRAGAHYGAFPELLAQLVIDYADGARERVVTDASWRARFGPVRHADLLMGERHDYGRELPGWDTPGFDAAGWRPVESRDLDERPLCADPGPPIRVTEEVSPRGITRDAAGRHIVDFGQNLPGRLRLTVRGPSGSTVRIRHAEVLTEGGALYTDNLRTARQADEVVTDGGDPTIFEPRFTVHGFRYAEISGYPGDLDPADVTARVVHSDIAAAGTFASSQDWLNRLFANIDWGQRGNFVGIPTDCPQRDERLGWLGDAQIFVRTACYNRDTAAFYHKWMDDVVDAQMPSGAFSDIAPRLSIPWAGAPAWGDAGVIVPWTLYAMYGDRGVLERHFDAMTAWMDFIERTNPDHLRANDLGNSYNDWLAPGDDDTPPELLATAYWAHDAALMAEVADAVGRPDEATGYRALASKIRAAFADAFVTPDGRVTSGTQTAYVLGLHMDLVPEDLRAAAAGHLVEAIRCADWHLTTGFVGVGYLLPVLSATGHTDVAYRLLEQRTLPSWRYMIDQGATTIWERWDGWTEENGFQSASMNSFNHYALGSVGEWLYRFALGIDLAPGAHGFDRLLLRPHPGGGLTWARGSYRSVRGPVRAGWERSGGRFVYRVELPPNVTADVHVPSADAAGVRDADGNGPGGVGAYPGTSGVQEAIFSVGSGAHEFTGRDLCP